MHLDADLAGDGTDALHAALRDYFKSPGKYPVALRQPPLLFARARDVLQVAAGRDPGAPNGGVGADLQEAACFFARTAMLYPGADHYALLGVERTADAAEIKDRYRLMMRLMHPDYIGPGTQNWPLDAAVRINRAYEVLSSPDARREYEERQPNRAQGSVPKASKSNGSARPAYVRFPRSRVLQFFALCGVIGAGAVLFGLLSSKPDAVQLVQRPKLPASPVPDSVAVAAAPPLAQGNPPTAIAAIPAGGSPLTLSMSTELATPPSHPPVNFRPPARVSAPTPQQRPLAGVRPSEASSNIAPPAQPVTRNERVEPAAPANPGVAEQTAQIAASLAPVPPATPRVPKPGLTLAEAQPLLTALLQSMEAGRGERLLNFLDREARSKPGAQALSRQFDGLVDGMRPVRLSHVEFRAEPAEGRLLVIGNLRLQVGEQTIGSLGKKLVLHAEFSNRDGTVVMTGLSGGTAN